MNLVAQVLFQRIRDRIPLVLTAAHGSGAPLVSSVSVKLGWEEWLNDFVKHSHGNANEGRVPRTRAKTPKL